MSAPQPRPAGLILAGGRSSRFGAEKAESIGWLLISTIFGPLPVEQGIARCVAFLELAGDDPTIRAWCCVERSVLEAMRGDFPLAR